MVQQLEIGAERLGALLDLASDAAIVTELETGRILFWNRAAERLYGWRSEEALGRCIHQLLHTVFPLNLETLHCILRERGAWEGDIRHTARDGSERIVATRWALHSETLGGPDLVLEMNNDLTGRRGNESAPRMLQPALEQRVAERTAQLAAANRELEAFAYSVSHDLRQPLRGLEAYSAALLEDYRDSLDERACHYIASIRRATQQMGQLIDDLLRLSRVTRAPLQYTTVPLTDLATTIMRTLREEAPERSVDVVIAQGMSVYGDRSLLQLALQNVLGNAWKFTSKRAHGRIEFGAEMSNGETVYFVRDDGAGFNPRYMDQLFVPFQRLHRPSEFPGTGIGLVIVQRVVQRHEGRIWAEGDVDRGATFKFTLPGVRNAGDI